MTSSNENLGIRLDQLDARVALIEAHLQQVSNYRSLVGLAERPLQTDSPAPAPVETTFRVEPVEPSAPPPIPTVLPAGEALAESIERRRAWAELLPPATPPAVPSTPAPAYVPYSGATPSRVDRFVAARQGPVEGVPRVHPDEPVSIGHGAGGAPVSGGAPATWAAPERVVAPRVKKSGASLELQIGSRWMAWVGALVVVLAVGFFIKLAVDQGWIGLIGPVTKCVLATAFGAALLAGGELALRKVGRAAAVSLFSAGLGTLYLTAFATFRYFNLVSESGAFWLLCFVAALGFALTIRGNMLTIGVLSILGGYGSPLLLQNASSSPIALPLYITALLGVALGLALRRPAPFQRLRSVALCAHGLLATGWALSTGAEHWLLVLSVMIFWWGMTLADAVLTARRELDAKSNVFIAILGTSWFVGLGNLVINRVHGLEQNWLGVFTAMAAMITAMLAIAALPTVEVLRRTPRTALEKLVVTLWALFGVLLTVSVALQFKDFGQSIGWLAIGLIGVELGRRLRAASITWFGLGVGGLGLLRVASLDRISSALTTVLFAAPQVTITSWSILALCAIAATHFAARRILPKRSGEPDGLATGLSVLSIIGWLALCDLQATGIAVTWGWLVPAVVLLGVERWGRVQQYFATAVVALVAAAGRFLIADALLPRLEPGWSTAAVVPVLNFQMLLAVAIGATGWWLWKTALRRAATLPGDAIAGWRAPFSGAWQAVILVGAVFTLIVFSLQIDSAVARALGTDLTATYVRQLLFTLLWAMGGLGVGLFAALQTRVAAGAPVMHHLLGFAWRLIAFCALKWLVWDCATLGLMRGAVFGYMPFVSLQLFVALTLAAAGMSLLFVFGLAGPDSIDTSQAPVSPRNALLRLARWVPVAAALIVLCGLALEVDRGVPWLASIGVFTADITADGPHLRLFAQILLWAAGGVVMLAYGARRPWRTMFTTGWVLLLLSTLTWIGVATLGWRVVSGGATGVSFANLPFVSGALLAGMLLWCVRRRFAGLRDVTDDPFVRDAARLATGFVCAIGLWLGSLEIDRFFAPQSGGFADAAMARQTALSIWWGVYGIGLVAAGFWRNTAALRRVGLALLGLTLAKVLLVDLANVGYVYRVLSLLAVGLLFMATSVAYGKLAARFGDRADERTGG